MGDVTGIAWTDYTYNYWEGCTKVGPGCDHCYAEARDARFHEGKHWGVGAPRRLTSIHNRNNLSRWDRAVEATGKRWVFCSSLSDVFDNAIDPAWRTDLFDRVRAARNLRFQLVTKRIGNVARMVPGDWANAFGHCGIIITVVNQAEAARDVIKLLRTPAAWRGISYEPALGAIDFRNLAIRHGGRKARLDALDGTISQDGVVVERLPGLDWLIVGGESGSFARPFDPAWAASIVAQGAATGVPVFVKQMGSNPVGMSLAHRKGEDPAEWPESLRIREMPRVYATGGRLVAA